MAYALNISIWSPNDCFSSHLMLDKLLLIRQGILMLWKAQIF